MLYHVLLIVYFVECQSKCNLNNLATGLAVKEVLQKDVKILHVLDSQMARIGMQESCRLTNCFLGCYKRRLDMECEGVAGSLLAVCFQFLNAFFIYLF